MSINLVKGAKISLEKPNGGTLNKVFVGLGWDAATGFFGGSIDLDASAITFDENKNVLETIYFGNLKSKDKSIKHSGDNLTGDGDGDDEVINVKLDEVDSKIHHIVFTINSFQGQTFDKVKNCFARLVDADTNTEICRYELAEKGDHTAKIMCKLYRHNGAWKMNALGVAANGRTAHVLADEAKAAL